MTLSTPYRKSSYHQNRKNGRGPDGKKMSRRTSTIKPSLIANTCKYSFFVHFDDNGFYVINGIGNTNHNSNPMLGQKETQVPVRLLQEVDTQFISDMGNGAASGSIIRNILFVKTGRHVSKQNINYMTKTVEQLRQDNDDSEANNLSGFATIMKKCEKKSSITWHFTKIL